MSESESNKLTGGCLCGAIRYSADTMPFASDYCHCTQCRRSSGGPVGIWMDFKAGQVSWSGTRPTNYESSEHVKRGFCPNCGIYSPIHRFPGLRLTIAASAILVNRHPTSSIACPSSSCSRSVGAIDALKYANLTQRMRLANCISRMFFHQQ